jgi:hypothetical protein
MGKGSDYTPGRTRSPFFSVGTGSIPTTEGSTRFGNTTDDLHIFTGSVAIAGTLSIAASGVSGSSILTQTTGAMNYYADGTAGLDTNDGLSFLTPKKTLTAVFALCPFVVKHAITFNLIGTFDIANEPTNVKLHKYVEYNNGSITIDGGAYYTTVVGPYACTAADKTYLEVGGTGFTADQYSGYLAQMNSGAQSGSLRTIVQTHPTSDRLTVGQAFTAAPIVADTFLIVRPTTTITKATQAYVLFLIEGHGSVIVKRIYTSGAFYFNIYGQSNIGYQLSVLTGMWVSSVGSVNANGPGVFAVSFTNCGIIMPAISNMAIVCNLKPGSFAYSYIKGILKIEEALYGNFFGSGARVNGIVKLYNVLASGQSRKIFSDSYTGPAGSYARTTIESSSAGGIYAFNSEFSIGAGVTINHCGTHGIELERSTCYLNGAVAGSNNGSFGVYAGNGSVLNLSASNLPTISGTLGELAISTSSSQEEVWTSFAAGGISNLLVSSENTLVRVVDRPIS